MAEQSSQRDHAKARGSYVRYHKGTAEARKLLFGQKTREAMFELKQMTPIDARPHVAGETELESLAKRGFCLTKFKSSVSERLDSVENMPQYQEDPANPVPESSTSKTIRETYFDEVCERIKLITGAKYVFFLSHVTRKGSTDTTGNRYLTTYATFAHTDYSESILPKKEYFLVKRGVPVSEIDNLEIALYNSWQPFNNAVEQNPLAVLDYRTLAANDLEDVITAKLDYPVTYSKKTNQLESPEITLLSGKHSDQHDWMYFPLMKPDELLLFAQMDPRAAYAKRCFHTSFYDSSSVAPARPKPRMSLEGRFVCAYERPSSKI
uniref:Uncharacterized protein n=1 Tax=Mucochytrium quahogii TaxID=96639 RepID=A0A7S2S4K7_9STRA|mmetsp:Transcript_24384/g.52852  ORF Transcript_24384/g.52852 Transcript_24384/m.52852 type:complete len:322 (+) Transcript_24384:469-1434(+)